MPPGSPANLVNLDVWRKVILKYLGICAAKVETFDMFTLLALFNSDVRVNLVFRILVCVINAKTLTFMLT